jgi:hypothetical protein
MPSVISTPSRPAFRQDDAFSPYHVTGWTRQIPSQLTPLLEALSIKGTVLRLRKTGWGFSVFVSWAIVQTTRQENERVRWSPFKNTINCSLSNLTRSGQGTTWSTTMNCYEQGQFVFIEMCWTRAEFRGEFELQMLSFHVKSWSEILETRPLSDCVAEEGVSATTANTCFVVKKEDD